MKKLHFLTIILLIGFLFLFSCKHGYSSKCPSVKKFQSNFFKFQPKFKGLVKVVSIKKSVVPGLCQVVLKLNNARKAIIYTDYEGRFIISGNIIDMKNKENITRENLIKLNEIKLSKELMKKLEKMVDITYGKGHKVLYFITDPDCPFCKRAERIVYKLAKKGLIKVKVILFPLVAIHPHSKEKSVSLICDKKGYKALLQGYESKNQCKLGEKKIKENIDFLIKKLHISAVPAFVFPNGQVRVGILPEKEILKLLGE